MRMNGCGRRGHAVWPMAAMMFGGRGWGHGRRGGWGDGFGDESGGRRGGRGRSRIFASGELRLVLLALIAEQPRHGYELIKAVEELAGGNYAPSPGVVYPTLNLLTDEGVVEEAAGTGSRKSYQVTDIGRKELDERVGEFEALVARLKAMADTEERHSSPPIRRAVGNLFAALRNRAATGDFDRETMHQVADILDEAARKIERL